MQIAILGIDLGKNSCSVVGLDDGGHVVVRRRMHRTSVIKFAGGLVPCVVAMEACCGAHHLGRLLRTQGHEVRLMSPEYVGPYVKAQKNDERDAEAIAEAATRPTMRTALLNQLRAVLLERGVAIPQGRHKLEQHLDAMLGGPEWADVAPRIRRLLRDMRTEWQALDRRIEAFDEEFALKARTDPVACRLATIPGIGVLNATALVAAIGNGETFARGRDLAAWLGLVPRQATTGGKPRLLGISKRGNKYLRKLLIHGARAAMPSLARSGTALGAWLRGPLARAHPNIVVVALANKLARIVWTVLRHGREFERTDVVAST